MNAINVSGLTKVFDDVTTVDDLSFSVEQGELFGLLGPNGAGKSTLINMLVTLLQPSGGTATVNGYDIRTEKGAVRNSLGIVFQEPALDEELTGAENLAFHSRLYGQSKADRTERIDGILELVGLRDERNDPVGSYSGGMKRRLEIGRGLLHEPSVLFLDEPTVGLDAHTRRDTWEYIERMNEEAGVSIILTTHYIEEAEHLCDRVAIVDEGEIAAIDSPAALTESIGGDVVTLEIDGTADPLVDRLDDRPWVHDYTATNSGLHVTIDDGDVRIVDLVRLADDAGVLIASIDRRKPNLESAFLSLTARETDDLGPVSSVGDGGTGDTLESGGMPTDDRTSAVTTEENE